MHDWPSPPGSGAREPIVPISRELFRRLCREAGASPRGRTNLNLHEPDDTYQRFLNVIQPGSYIQPHRHAAPPKSESFIVLQGRIGFFQFDEDGHLIQAVRLGPDAEVIGVDVRPGVWHTFFALQPDTVVFEGKNGPYDPHTDKTFAPWAPGENDPGAAEYMHALIDRLPAADAAESDPASPTPPRQ